MAVGLTRPDAGDRIEHGAPRALFSARGSVGYAASADGQRFLLNQVVEEAPSSPLTILINWRPR
jgi:hypothetical protein